MEHVQQRADGGPEVRAWRPRKARLMAYQNISATHYDTGEIVVSHGRLDAHSGRMVFDRLSAAEAPVDCPHYVAWALAHGAEEVLREAHEESPHL